MKPIIYNRKYNSLMGSPIIDVVKVHKDNDNYVLDFLIDGEWEQRICNGSKKQTFRLFRQEMNKEYKKLKIIWEQE